MQEVTLIKWTRNREKKNQGTWFSHKHSWENNFNQILKKMIASIVFSSLLHLKASVHCRSILHVHNTIHQAFALGLWFTINLQFCLTKGKKWNVCVPKVLVVCLQLQQCPVRLKMNIFQIIYFIFQTLKVSICWILSFLKRHLGIELKCSCNYTTTLAGV